MKFYSKLQDWLAGPFSQKMQKFMQNPYMHALQVCFTIILPMIMVGSLASLADHFLIALHLRRCQYHIKIIDDLGQLCIAVGLRFHVISLGFPCFSCARCNHATGNTVSTDKQNSHCKTSHYIIRLQLMYLLSLIYLFLSIFRLSYPLGKRRIAFSPYTFYNRTN